MRASALRGRLRRGARNRNVARRPHRSPGPRGGIRAWRQPNAPLLAGAVKTNLGHLEAAAGIVGLIKTTMAMQRGTIPANLHFESPNPHIPFDELRLKVVDEPTEWPVTGRRRLAGVSSFGFGGTNAHLVLEQGPDVGVPDLWVAPAVATLVVSGKDAGRVAVLASTLADWMTGAGALVPLPDVAHTLNHHRSQHAMFATVCAADRAEAIAGLRAVAAGEPATGVVHPHQGPCGSGTVFVYSGQGSQWAGMGRQLLADEPAFAAAVAALEPDFVAQVGFSLHDVLAGAEALTGIERIQPVVVGVQLALTALWRSHGIEPDAVIGHSMGEVTAAVVAGALTPAQGLQVIATRSRLMAERADKGAMALLELDAPAVEALIADSPGVTVAVYASPSQTAVAGPIEAVEAVIARATQQNTFARRVDVEVASHHAMMDPILPELREAFAGLTPRLPLIRVISTVENAGAAPLFDADHWVANLRNPVRFSQAVATAGATHCTFIEISPHPLLTKAISDTLDHPSTGNAHHHSLGTLQRDAHDTVEFHTNRNATHTVRPPHGEHQPEPHPAIPITPWRAPGIGSTPHPPCPPTALGCTARTGYRPATAAPSRPTGCTSRPGPSSHYLRPTLRPWVPGWFSGTPTWVQNSVAVWTLPRTGPHCAPRWTRWTTCYSRRPPRAPLSMSRRHTLCSTKREALSKNYFRCPHRRGCTSSPAMPSRLWKAIAPTRHTPFCGVWAERSPWNIPKSGAA